MTHTSHSPKSPRPPVSDSDDMISVVLHGDPYYKTVRKDAFDTFKQHYNQQHTSQLSLLQQLIMTTKTIFSKLAHSTVALVILGITVFSGVTGLAMETLAPTEYKPSTVIQKTFNPKQFEANKQSDASPYTALVPDETNDVAASTFCDLAIKYPKQFDGRDVQLTRITNMSEEGQSDSIGFNLSFEADESYPYYNIPSIACSDYNPFDSMTEEKKQLQDQGIIGHPYGTVVPNGREFIAQNFGWFVTQKEDVEFIVYSSYDPIYGRGGIPNSYTIEIISPTRHYTINNVATADAQVDFNVGDGTQTLKALTGNKIQLQFNSITDNTLSAEILENEQKDILVDGFNTVNLQLVDGVCSDIDNQPLCQLYFIDDKQKYYVFDVNPVSDPVFQWMDYETMRTRVSQIVSEYKNKDLLNLDVNTVAYTSVINFPASHSELSIPVTYWINPNTQLDQQIMVLLENWTQRSNTGFAVGESVQATDELMKIAQNNNRLVTIAPKNTNLYRSDAQIGGPTNRDCGIPGMVVYASELGGDGVEASYGMNIIHKDFEEKDYGMVSEIVNLFATKDKEEIGRLLSMLESNCFPMYNYVLNDISVTNKYGFDTVRAFSVLVFPFESNTPMNYVVILGKKGDHYVQLAGRALPANSNAYAEAEQLAQACGGLVDPEIQFVVSQQPVMDCYTQQYTTASYRTAQQKTVDTLMITFQL